MNSKKLNSNKILSIRFPLRQVNFLAPESVIYNTYLKTSRSSYLGVNKPYLFNLEAYSDKNANFQSQISNFPNKNLDTYKPYYWNQCFDKGRLKNFVLWFFRNNGEHKTVQLVEEFKNLGFQYATKAGISLGVEDLKIPPKKASLIFLAEKETASTIKQYKRGDITGVERFQRLIDTWHRTSEQLKQEVIDNFEATDILNPVYMMAFSGARGNISQVRQLVGMRGLMSNPQGQIIDFPIRSNFREGLTLTEYIISSYGARKGIVDTALRTANAGYLTRRLVDVAQHVIISNFDCGTRRGIFLKDMKEGNKTIVSLNTRLIGRVCANDIYSSTISGINGTKIAKRNQEISIELAHDITKISKKVFVRSALTCETKKLVCQLCYGWSLAQGNLVSIGEAIGVIAAQSIGEPGTQLTMRTFHTGGVFAGDVTDQIRMQFSGIVIYNAPIPGTLIRTPEGKIAFLTKNNGSFTICKVSEQDHQNLLLKQFTNNPYTSFTPANLYSLLPEDVQTKKYKIPPFTLLYAKNGDFFNEKEVVAQMSSISKQKNATDEAELTIKSEIDGQLHINFLDLKEKKVGPKLTKKENNDSHDIFTSTIIKNSNCPIQKNGPTNLMESFFEAWNWGNAWILSSKIYHSPTPSSFFPQVGDFLNSNSLMNGANQLSYLSRVSGETKLEYPLILNPKYQQPLISQKVIDDFNKKRIKTTGSQTQKTNTLSHSILPMLNNEFLKFSLKNLTYKNIGYYIHLNKSFEFKNSIELKPYLLKKIQIQKNTQRKSLLTAQDGIFVIPENNQVLFNKSLIKLYPSNWQPDFKTVLQWFPSSLKTKAQGIIAIEEIPLQTSFKFDKNPQSTSIILPKKINSLYILHKKMLAIDSKNVHINKKRYGNKISNSIQNQILCLNKHNYTQLFNLKEVKVNKLKLLTSNSLDSDKQNLSFVPAKKNQKLQGLKQPQLNLQQKPSKFSRLFSVPTLNHELFSKKINLDSNESISFPMKNKKSVKTLAKILLTKKQNFKTLKSKKQKSNFNSSVENQKQKITTLKSFISISFHSLKKYEQKFSLLKSTKEFNIKTKDLTKINPWIYFLPKQSLKSNKFVKISPSSKIILYPGQSFNSEINFDQNIIAVSKFAVQRTPTENSQLQINQNLFNIEKWIKNKNNRYSLVDNTVLSFTSEKNSTFTYFNQLSKTTDITSLDPNSTTHTNLNSDSQNCNLVNYELNLTLDRNGSLKEVTSYYAFAFQNVNELSFSFFNDDDRLNLKNDIYEFAKYSDNPMNGLNKIKSFYQRTKKRAKTFKFAKVYNGDMINFVKLFTNISTKTRMTENSNQNLKYVKTESIIKRLNYLFLISPPLDSLNSNKTTKKKENSRLLKNLHQFLYNNSYSSFTELKMFKNCFVNKQKISLPLLSKYPNLDINLISQFPTFLNFDNITQINQKQLTTKNILSRLSSKHNHQNQKLNSDNHTLLPEYSLRYGFIENPMNLFHFYITIPFPETYSKTQNIKNKDFQLTESRKSNVTILDYPFKNFKISYTKNSSFNSIMTKKTPNDKINQNKKPVKVFSPFIKNYLKTVLFSPTVINEKNLKFNYLLKNSNSIKQSNLLIKNDSYSVPNWRLNLEVPNLLILPYYRSMFSYSLEPIFSPLPETNQSLKNQVCTNLSLDGKINQSHSIVKFYGTIYKTVSPLVSFAKTFSYSPFEGEILTITSPYGSLKTGEKSLKMKFYFENQSIRLQKKQHVSILLTKQDLVSYYLNKTKNKQNRITQNEYFTQNTKSTLDQLSKQYLIQDTIIPFQDEQLDEKIIQSENNFESKFGTRTKVFKISQLSGGFPVTKRKQIPIKNIKFPLFEQKLKSIESSYNKEEKKTKTLTNLNGPQKLNGGVFEIGDFIVFGDKISLAAGSKTNMIKNELAVSTSGQIIHINKDKLTIRKGQPLFISPKSILHKLDGDFVESKSPVITLSYQRLRTGDIVQGIPKIEQFFEARTTKRGRLFRDSLPNLLKALFKRYLQKMSLEKAVRQSFYKLQQIIVDGVLRVYRSQGVTISDKHLEIIVKQMTSKVRILEGGQTGFFPGEVVDLEFVEHVNSLLMKKIQYEPLVLGITRSSLEVDSFLSAASFQQTTRVLSQASISRKKDFLKGLKENVILGNLIPAGTGYLVYLTDTSQNDLETQKI